MAYINCCSSSSGDSVDDDDLHRHQGHYDVPRVAAGLGQQSFAVADPKAWNSLPSELRCIAVDSTFRHHLKAELFSRAYDVSINI